MAVPLGGEILSNLFAASPQVDIMSTVGACQSVILGALPAGYANISAVLVNNNLAVIPGEWEAGGIGVL
jgi:hypothetical protein